MNDPLLIDECLSPDLVATANARGHHATHVTFRWLQGSPDHALLSLIDTEGFVLVTNNGRDFLKLYRSKTVHPGLIIIVPGGTWAREQTRLLGLALDVIEPMPNPINKVVEVTASGEVTMRDLSSS